MSDLFDLPFEDDDRDLQPAAPEREHASPVEAGQAAPARRDSSDDRLVAERRVYSVSELTVRVRDLLEEALQDVWIEGELSNCRPWNGHLYFTLKDDRSQVRGFMFRSSVRYLKFKPTDGTRVIARGRISVYEPKGEYQLVCEYMEPQGLGALQLAFEQLKKRLQADGLFDTARKRPLPALPRKIGIVTSLDGAAIRDIVKVLRRRYVNAHLIVRPVRVQGEGAAPDIARGLVAIGRVPGVDVVIVGRGGGSIEDLWAFNDEAVARAIAQSPVPVVSAVGHESDVTIADLVADLRAPTPSAAAELVVAAKDEFSSRIGRLADRLLASARARVQRLSRQTHVLAGRPALAGIPGRVANRARHAAELTHALGRLGGATLATRERRLQQLQRQLAGFDLGRRLASIRTRLVEARTTLSSSIERRTYRAGGQLASAAARLETLSPLAVLGRGYAVCWSGDRTRVVRSASEVRTGDAVHVTLAEGALDCDVRATSTEPPVTPPASRTDT